MYPTSGALLAGPVELPEAVQLPVGIVADDLEKVAAYLDAGPLGPYVVIRTAADVPPRLGGIALLDVQVDVELRDALVRAMGV